MEVRVRPSRSETVLVTGAAGYLGSILCEHLLDAGMRVMAVDNLMFGNESLFHLCANPRFDFICGDARDTRPAAAGEPVRRRSLRLPDAKRQLQVRHGDAGSIVPA